ncbi:hypothetical protein ACFST9_06495 [Hymenobacter monticola]|uniref:Uncharacterized protein n=1 Tax=Hymenobacter monticola TaxID=1705399 RepID=A0ABY4BBJ5_9BACT|nr:hypothetical protein [Hymenobacter monticola]UOE36264.1 hypothetical protein MTP16_11615 [Hymenobacter monticola]
MPHQVTLEQSRIQYCDWTEAGGELEYDISHLHPDWGVLIQTYRVASQNYDGQLIYESEFTLYKRGESVACIFADYPKAAKIELWKIIFAVKRKFFDEVEPAIVTHHIKQDHSVDQRYQLYAKYLDLPDYDIVPSHHDFTYFRKSFEDELEFA